MTDSARLIPALRRPSGDVLALAGVAVCALIWGTTWYAITLQLGPVEPTASVTWRFGLAAMVLFVICAVTRKSIRLTRVQHLAAAGQGIFAFSLSYSFVYQAETLITSGIVAVAFASMALMNLILFRIVEGQRAAQRMWIGAALGALGVAVLSGGELAGGQIGKGVGGAGAAMGVSLAMAGAFVSTVANWFAWRGQKAGSAVLPSTAWAMAYGAAMVAVYGLATGVKFSIAPTPAYLGSLFYLSVFGSVIAFLIYFSVARSRGFTLASYIGALTPPLALAVSALLEGARFGWTAVAGVVLVVGGQILIARAPKPAPPVAEPVEAV